MQDGLDLLVGGDAVSLLGLRHAQFQQPIHLRILILHIVRALAMLRRDHLGMAARGVVWIETHRRIPGHQQRVEARLRGVFAPHHARWHVADLHLHADRFPVLLEQRLAALPRDIARGGGHGEFQRHAVLRADAVRALPPAGLVQQLLSAGGIVGVVAQVAVVGPVRGLQVGQGARPGAEIDVVDRLLHLRRHGQRAAHARVAELWLAAVEVDELHVGRRVAQEVTVGEGARFRPTVVRHAGQREVVHLPRARLAIGRHLVRHEFVDELADLGRAAVIVRVALIDHVAAGGAAAQGEGPCADRLAVEGCRLDVLLPPQDVLRDDVHVLPRPQERHEGARQFHLDRMVVLHAEGLDQVEARTRPHRDRRVHDGLVGELDILRGEGLAVRPFHVALEVHRPGQPIGRDTAILPRRHLHREVRDEVALVVHIPQRIEQAGFGHVLGAGIDIEQRVELYRFLRHRQDDAVPVDGLRPDGGRGEQRRGTGKNTAARNPDGHVASLLLLVNHGSMRSRGSSASRSPSPRKLKPITVSVIAAPGRMASQGTVSKYPWALVSMLPHDASGGCTP